MFLQGLLQSYYQLFPLKKLAFFFFFSYSHDGWRALDFDFSGVSDLENVNQKRKNREI